MNILVSADSTCDLSPELVEKYHIEIVPLYLVFDGKDLKDGIETTPDDAYSFTERTGKLCSTAAVSVDDYLKFFGAKLKEFDQIIHFHISSEMSSCYQNAVLAASGNENIFLVDSENLSTGIGQLVLDAREMADAGMDGASIKKILDEKKKRLDVSFIIDRLDYLRNGGRCSTVAALGASLLNLKPCIEVTDGKMSVGKKYRGKLQACLKKYVKERLGGRDDIETHRIFITHSGRLSEEELEEVRQEVAQLQEFDDIFITRAGGTISCHCGPRTLGILYYHTK